MCMCNIITISDLALQISYFKVKRKLNKSVFIQKKVIYAMKIGICTSFFPCSNISAKSL